MISRTIGAALALGVGGLALTAIIPALATGTGPDPSEDGPAPAAAPLSPGTPADQPAAPEASAQAPVVAPPATPPAPATVIGFDAAVIDPKIPGRVRVDLHYTCSSPEGERSLNTSVEQTDPADPAAIAFGSTRTSPTVIVCDGTQQRGTVTVQSKTTNWLDDVDAVLVTTVSDLGATPPAAADAAKLRLHTAPAPAVTP
ncbi:hypothetical protein AB0D08_26985 [Kitasatospora sp. NPDC048540]|uniref:hypothetical protein n=1 Tax=Kitasatospora sp. NPDC048540 TaxID=3155634 RepID=UPI0033C5EB56